MFFEYWWSWHRWTSPGNCKLEEKIWTYLPHTDYVCFNTHRKRPWVSWVISLVHLFLMYNFLKPIPLSSRNCISWMMYDQKCLYPPIFSCKGPYYLHIFFLSLFILIHVQECQYQLDISLSLSLSFLNLFTCVDATCT